MHPKAIKTTIATLTVLLAALVLAPAGAIGSHSQVTLFEEELHLFTDPSRTLQELRHLGVGMVRVEVRWSLWAPDPKSHRRPQFDATDPNAYPAADWAALDQIVLDAAANGIQVMMVPSACTALSNSPQR